jgi:splicing factor 3B subunit 3
LLPALQGPELDDDRAATEMQFGSLKGAAGQWASCVRAIDPSTAATTCVAELDDNEGAVSLALVDFSASGTEGTYLVVGTAQGLAFNPRQADGASPVACLRCVGGLDWPRQVRQHSLQGHDL